MSKNPEGIDPSMPDLSRRAKRLRHQVDRTLRRASESEVSRRAFNRAALGFMACFALTSAEQKVGTWWKSGNTELRVYKEGHNPRSTLFGVSVGGLGDANAMPKAKDMFAACGGRIPWSGLIESEQHGENLMDNARLLRKAYRERRFTHLAIDGESLGGKMGLYSALLANVPVGAVLLNSAPPSLDQARFWMPAELAASPLNPRSRLLGAVELGITDLGDDIQHQGLFRFVRSITSELSGEEQKLQREGSPMLRRSQLEDAQSVNIWELGDGFISSGVITQGTRMAYVMTPEEYQDDVIHTNASADIWTSWAKETFNIEVERIYMHGQNVHHADAYAAARSSEAWWQSVIDQYDGYEELV